MEVFTAFFWEAIAHSHLTSIKGQIVLALTSIWTTILLAAAVALGPLAVDMYLPALPPQIGADFDAGTDQVQLTLSVYLAASPSHNSSAGRWPTALAANPS